MTHASLFSGIGGPEIAAAMLGWENLFHCEINPFGRQILEYWFPKSKSYEDITKTDFRKWRGKVDILTGGFPCQPFSYAGQRRGADDDRYLWPEMLRVIDEVRPAWVVGENVAGITTMVEPGEVSALGVQATLFGEGDGVHGYRYRQPFTIERVCGDLESLGYSVQPLVVPACAVGAPHRRDRVFIVARRKEESAAADTCHAGLQEARPEQPTAGHRGFGVRTGEWVERFGRGEEIGSRWQNFPSVSPVHRGNDGLPFDVDRLTIPFSKWRTESLKAYGNAIVPQVMYEIFSFIEIVEEGGNNDVV